MHAGSPRFHLFPVQLRESSTFPEPLAVTSHRHTLDGVLLKESLHAGSPLVKCMPILRIVQKDVKDTVAIQIPSLSCPMPWGMLSVRHLTRAQMRLGCHHPDLSSSDYIVRANTMIDESPEANKIEGDEEMPSFTGASRATSPALPACLYSGSLYSVVSSHCRGQNS